MLAMTSPAYSVSVKGVQEVSDVKAFAFHTSNGTQANSVLKFKLYKNSAKIAASSWQ